MMQSKVGSPIAAAAVVQLITDWRNPGVGDPITEHVSEIEITWGRKGIYTAPARRSATVTAYIPTSLFTASSVQWLGAFLDIKTAGRDLFSGIVNTLTPRPAGRDKVAVVFHATEVPGSSPAFEYLNVTERFYVDNTFPMYTTLMEHARLRGRKLPEIDPSTPDMRVNLSRPTGGKDLTLWRALEGSTATLPMVWPSWAPGYKKIAATHVPYDMYSVAPTYTDIDLADSQIIWPTMQLTERPTQLTWKSTSDYGDQRETVRMALQWNRSQSTPRSAVKEITAGFSLKKVFVEMTSSLALELESDIRKFDAAQATTARQFRFIDTNLPADKLPGLFTTWERNGHYVRVGEGDQFKRLFPGVTGVYSLIGGTMRITSDKSTHACHALYIPRLPRRWNEMTKPYSAETTLWSD